MSGGLATWSQEIQRGYEGYVAKAATSSYEQGPTRRRLKVKVLGWTVEGDGWRRLATRGWSHDKASAYEGWRLRLARHRPCSQGFSIVRTKERGAMLDRTRSALSAEDLDHLKEHPEAANGARWIPMLVAEVERLREQMKILESQVGRHEAMRYKSPRSRRSTAG